MESSFLPETNAEMPQTYSGMYGFRKAKQYAIAIHTSTNHFYDGYLPYEFHLRMVHGNFEKYKHLVPKTWHDVIFASCYLHDTIEDARIKYSDIKAEFGADVANIVYAVTNDKGRNRAERESDNYFAGIKNTFYATFVKLCDRIANIEYSKMTAWRDSGKLEMYRKEHARFKEKLYDEKYKPMFDYIEYLLDEVPQ